MSRRSTPRLCICGRSSRLPLCDGTHRADDWSCDRVPGPDAPVAFLTDPTYANLADRLAHRFDGVVLDRRNAPPRVGRLVVLTSGHPLRDLQARVAATPHEACTVIGIGVADETLGWAFPGAEHTSLTSLSGVALWAEAESFLLEGEGRKGTPPRPRVFLSHAHQDEAALFPSIEALREIHGLDLFVCADSIPRGADWHATIEGELRSRDMFLAVISEHAARSTFCAFEAGMAVALDKPVRLVSLDGAPPPAHLQHLQSADVPRLRARKPWLPSDAAVLEAVLTAVSSDRADASRKRPS